MYAGLTACVSVATIDTPEHLARRLIHIDFRKAGIVLASAELEEIAAGLIAKLLDAAAERQREIDAKIADAHSENWPCSQCSASVEPAQCADIIAASIRNQKANTDV
jgi:hypothetical protein